MTDDVYRQLALHLDKIPNGYPATKSGVELRLLEKIFLPEEAALAIHLRLTPETAETIATRAGLPAREALSILKTMVRKGQIELRRKDRSLLFALMPFVVGIYEMQLPRLDAEMAALFEEYFQDLKGNMLRAVHRVIPVEETASSPIAVLPHESARSLIENAKAWGVQDCICRTQQRLIGKGCNHSIGYCISFADVPGVFDHGTTTKGATKEEALAMLRAAGEEGLVHTVANHRDGLWYICNCCPCCCGVLRSITEFQAPAAVARSPFRAEVIDDLCAGCEDCIPRCPFGALAMADGKSRVDAKSCLGCGVCLSACATDALRLIRLSDAEIPPLPRDHADWQKRIAAEQGIAMDEIA